MSQLKAKQIKLPTQGDLLIGGKGGTGAVISAANNSDKILRVVNGAPAWSVNDHLVSPNGFNTVKTTDGAGIVMQVQNATGTAAQTLATFKSGSTSDERYEFSSTPGALTIAAVSTTSTDVDIVITPQGNGDVIIGNEGGGIIQADDGEDLQLLGGAPTETRTGNLLLFGGGEAIGQGKVYYAKDTLDDTREVATVGNVAAATAAAVRTQTRKEFDGSQTFVLDVKTIPGSIIAHVNGLVIKDDYYAYSESNQTLTFSGLPYALDNVDQVVFTYENAA